MKHEEQRIAIAQACGWILADKDGNWIDKNGHYGINGCPPDYLHDLNAMHEAEEILQYEQWADFLNYLVPNVRLWSDYDVKNGTVSAWKIITHATAAQRAEAFLKTLNLWKP